MRNTKTKARWPLDLGHDAKERGRDFAGSAKERSAELGHEAGRRGRELAETAKERSAELGRTAAKLDIKWAHGPIGHALREGAGRLLLVPLMTLYTRRRVLGRENLDGLKGPVVLVANHASHMDTPAILRALPRPWRRRTVVGAAADYFYRNRLVATLISVLFNTVPIERRRGSRSIAHIDRLLDRGNSLLLYPEGTRSRKGGVGQLRHGAASIAAKHGASIVPIHVSGTRDAMPPGRLWPKRKRSGPLSRRHPVTVTFGKPIKVVADDRGAVTDRIGKFFEQAQTVATQSAQGARRGARLPGRRRKQKLEWLPGRGKRRSRRPSRR
jgi:1-acyl-sn-glycerol-3-phosphate acyltransferase